MMNISEPYDSSNDIAIVGMAGRFPGVKNLDEYWHALQQGKETISFLKDEDLLAAGIAPDILKRPNYVKAGGILEDIELFDASFFGFTIKEAEITDPQHRLFLESAWEALENANCDPETYKGKIGVYAGARMSGYLMQLYSNPDLIRAIGSYRVLMGNDKDYLATWTSYKMNLRGPSMAIQTACSTSLVAVHMACQSLLNGECDMALAGGVSIFVPQRSGYFYQEGGIASPDGHCRAFDAKAEGTVRGSGVGVVVLKRLAEAVADRDSIYAVIKGSAINNDGSMKVGFTAPSVEGQAEVIAEAQAVAGVTPESIDYIEAHGTGTSLGDPIEVEALTRVFRATTGKRGFCAIGSVKTNIGHLDTAAGVAGLIKTALALRHRQIPPSLNFEQPNPRIAFDQSPFHVNSTLRDWPANGHPRRAGVSSFGIGGTNAHVVLQEAPAPDPSEASRPWQLILLSAKTETALEQATANLTEHLRQHPEVHLPDVAFTLQVGRRPFNHRRMLVCRNTQDCLSAVDARDAKRVFTSAQAASHRPVVFLFPGQGTQYVNMALGLYQTEPAFREQVTICAKLLEPSLGFDLRDVLYPAKGDEEAAGKRLDQTQVTQPAIFTIEYALAKLWMEWGVRPEAMIGHSIGEYVAACLAGVLSLEDALTLTAQRAKLMQKLPPGAMTAVRLSEAELRPFVGDQLSLAAINGPTNCVVSGPAEAVDQLERRLAEQGIACRRLATSHAFHSKMIEQAADEFLELVKRVKLNSPHLPYLSNLTGTWMTAAQATDPAYWVKHMVQTVRFADGMRELLKEPERILLELGPGQTLCNLAKQQREDYHGQVALSSLEGSARRAADDEYLLVTLGKLWLAGAQIDWQGFHSRERLNRVPLPTYPFERKRYWIDAVRQNNAKMLLITETEPSKPDSISSSNLQNNSIDSREAEALMSQTRLVMMSKPSQRAAIMQKLKEDMKSLTGLDPAAVDPQATFFELGADSLLLVQIAHTIQDKFGVKVPFRRLFEDLSTLDSLADYLDGELPPEAIQQEPSAPDVLPQQPIARLEVESAKEIEREAARENAIAFTPLPVSSQPQQADRATGLEAILSQQLQVMSQLMSEQLKVLRNGHSVANPIEQAQQAAPLIAKPCAIQSAEPVARPVIRSSEPENGHSSTEAYLPFQPREVVSNGALTRHQQDYLDAFIARYTRRTAESKRRTQAHRYALAEPRASLGFRLLWKEIIYPIIAERSAGSRIWDVDGNEYIDIAMGFGVNLFGHSAAFITEALEAQLKRGMQIGPQSDLAGEVAELLCELTGMERAVFCNSGTEAVMAAMRLARAVTRRTKIALFAGSYHGTFDGTLARAKRVNGKKVSVPLSPGTTPGMIEDILVLSYDSPESLEIIEAHRGELAAVLVEPVQSRRPDVQPGEFLRELRRLTESSGTALIFDEVVTGFRSHPGGAQALFGVRADIATYGKVIGGGMPIGVVAGKAEYMDAIDGGMWNYGDDSYPQAEQTFFAGTFCKHPLAMAAARAVLTHLKEQGPALQQGLTRRTTELADSLNTFFSTEQVPVHVGHFGSLLYFIPARNLKTLDLFFYHLIDKGIYNWEGRTCYLSTAHTDEDIHHVTRAVKESVAEMREAGFLPAPAEAGKNGNGKYQTVATDLATNDQKVSAAIAINPSPGTNGGASKNGHKKHSYTLPLTEVQKQLWFLAQLGGNISGAYHESATLKFTGPFNLEAMRGAMEELVARHDALRTTFSQEGDHQQVHAEMVLEIPITDLSHLESGEREYEAALAVESEVRRPFDLAKGPLVRAHILKLEPQHHYLIIVTHHIISDGRSYGLLLRELSALYGAKCQGTVSNLPAPIQFGEYAEMQARWQQGVDLSADEAYWEAQFADKFPILELPTDRPRAAVESNNGARHRVTVDQSTYADLKKLNTEQGCTMFVTLLSGFNLLLHQLSGQDDLVVGINVAQQLSTASRDFVGFRINPLSLRSKPAADPKLSEYLAMVKQTVLDAYEHQNVSVNRLNKKTKARRDSGRLLLVSAAFNLDQGGGELGFYGLQTEITSNHNGHATLDIYLNVIDRRTQLVLECDYNSDLFLPSTIERWVEHLQSLLKAIAADANLRISELPAFAPTTSQAMAEPEPQRETSWLYNGSNLTKYQQLIWAGQKLNPEVAMYTNAGYGVSRGAIDMACYQQAIQALVDHSDALRTVIEEIDGAPHQRVVEEFPYEVECVDFSQAEDPHAALHQWASRRCQVPFELSRRLFDIVLIKLSDDEFGGYLNAHHIIADARSVEIIIKLMGEYYELALEGRLEAADTLPLFQDFVAGEREYLESSRSQKSAAYWSEKLAEQIEPLHYYGRSPAKQSCRVERVSCHLGAERTQKIKELAAREDIFVMSMDTSAHNLFAALVFAFLHRITGSRRISLGDPFHNRRSKQQTIGLLMQILPIRVSIDESDSFLSLIYKVAAEHIKVLRHSEYPIGNPLEKRSYDVEYNYITARNPDRFAQSPVKHQWLHSGSGYEDLVIQVHLDNDANFVCEFDFHCDLFDQQQRRQAISHFLQVVDAFLEDESQQVASVNLLTAEEKQRLLVEFNRSEMAFPANEGFIHLFEAQARKTPHRPAVSSERGQMTYSELNARANQLAHQLRECGVAPEVVVALLGRRSMDYLAAVLAIFKAGGVYMPLDPHYPSGRLNQVLNQSGCHVVIAERQFAADLYNAFESRDSVEPPLVLELEDLLESDGTREDVRTITEPSNLAYVIYTSGSTGIPKGAMIEQAGMLNHLYVKVNDLQLTEDDVLAQTASQSFDISVWQFLAALLVGGRVHIANDEIAHGARQLQEEVERQRVSVLEVVPSLLRAMLEDAKSSRDGALRLDSLRLLLVTGEALPPDLCRRWLGEHAGIPLLNAYGPTECSDDVTHYLLQEPPGESIINMPIGSPVGNTQIYITGRRLEPVPMGMTGEICVGGIGVGRGYLNDPARTAEVFVPDPFASKPGARLYRTGDSGRHLADGNIEYLGRIDHQVKVRGFRIELGEIEVALSNHPSVRANIVMAREDVPGDKRLVAYIVADKDQSPAVGELRAFLKERVPDYMIPSAFVTLEALPLTANGKVDRRALPAPDTSRPELEAVFAAPRNAVEELLAKIWSEALNLDQIGIHDNFFELGGDSILTIQIAAKAGKQGVRIQPMQVFEHQTIAELAEVAGTAQAIEAEQAIVTGDVPLTPIQRWFFEQQVVNPHHWNQAVVLELRQTVDAAMLEQAVEQLLMHHDALRLRFTQRDSQWQQFNAAMEESKPFSRIDLSALPEAEQVPALESAAARLQASLNIHHGPLVRVALFDFGAGRPSRLFIVVHHLAVDGVSWRILLEDLQAFYRSLAGGGRIELPPKSSSFKQWAERLAVYSTSNDLRQELNYWLAQSSAQAAALPVDFPGGDNARSSTRVVSASLDSAQTRALLYEVPQFGQAQINDLLLTALTRAFSKWTGSHSLLIEMEGHGREDLFDDVDVSRTVGWFTTIFPVSLSLEGASAPLESLEAIQGQLQRIPKRGIGYGLLRYLGNDSSLTDSLRGFGQAEVNFNYLGQFDQMIAEDSLFAPAGLSGGPTGSRQGERPRLLDINGLIVRGQLRLDWTYSENLHKRSTIERLAESFLSELRLLIAACLRPQVKPYADASAAQFVWSKEELEDITSVLNKATGEF